MRIRAAARIPALLFSAVAVSGITVDLLKVIVGRPRPKLFFSAGNYEFSWIGLSADHWSFPSGHAATAAALATALWCLWPQPVLFYVVCAALDPFGGVAGFAEIFGLAGVAIAGVYVQDIARIGTTVLGHRAAPVTELAISGARSVFIAGFDADRLVAQLQPCLPAEAQILSLDAM